MSNIDLKQIAELIEKQCEYQDKIDEIVHRTSIKSDKIGKEINAIEKQIKESLTSTFYTYRVGGYPDYKGEVVEVKGVREYNVIWDDNDEHLSVNLTDYVEYNNGHKWERKKIGPLFRQTRREVIEDLINSYENKEIETRETKLEWKRVMQLLDACKEENKNE